MLEGIPVRLGACQSGACELEISRLFVGPPAHAIVLSVDEKSQFRRSTAPTRTADEE
jgi:hypothetical protein